MSPDPKVARVVRRAYMGRRLADTAKLAHAYCDADDTDSIYVVTKPYLAGVSIGTIVAVSESGTGTYWVSGPNAPRADGRFSDAQEVSSWVAMSRADVARADAVSAAKRATSELEAAVDLVAAHYKSLPGMQRSGFMAWVLSKL